MGLDPENVRLGYFGFNGVARIADGATLEQVRAELGAMLSNLAEIAIRMAVGAQAGDVRRLNLLAAVLIAIGVAMVLAGPALSRLTKDGPLLRVLPVGSAVVVTLLGVVILVSTAVESGLP